jgi:hypothetical protein
LARGFSRWSHVFGLTLASFFLFVLMCFIVLERFPWQTIYADYGLARESRFLTPWPQSAMEEEQQDRRRLKRFAKPEVRRRFGIQLRRMESLQSSLFDPFVDSGLTKQGLDKPYGPLPGPLFELPFFSVARAGLESVVLHTQYFAIPESHRVDFLEGVSLDSGDDLRMTIPISINRRTIDFNVFTRSPGSLRGYLGQYTWVRNFSEQDIHRKIKVSIPINDTGATALRFTSQGASMILLNLQLGQWDKSGRNSILLSRNSNDGWIQEVGTMPVAQSLEKSDFKLNPISKSKKQAADSVENEEDSLDDNAVTEIPEEMVTVQDEASLPSEKVQKKSDKSEAMPPDPLEQTNNLILKGDDKTLALGYNLMMLQLGAIDIDLLENEKTLLKLAPQFHQLLRKSMLQRLNSDLDEKSVQPKKTLKIQMDELQKNMFFQTNFPAFKANDAHRNSAILLDAMHSSEWKALPAFLRNFGYQVSFFAPSDFVTLEQSDKKFSSDLPDIERRWLSKEDGEFAKGNREIERLNSPATGLDAIFQSDNAPSSGGFTTEELLRIGDFSDFVYAFQGKVPDLRAHQMSCPVSGTLYLPSLVHSFQNWSKESYQSRFFAHLVLEPKFEEGRSSLKDLLKSLKSGGLKSLISPSHAKMLGNQVLLNRALDQILSTLKARKVTHRTVLLWLVPVVKNGEFKFWLSGQSVPGLVPMPSRSGDKTWKNESSTSFNDWFKGALTLVGIPRAEIAQVNIFPEDFKETKPIRYRKMRMQVYAGEGNRCSSMSWNGGSELLGLKANVPISFVKDSGIVSGFLVEPCLWKNKVGVLEWNQRVEKPLQTIEVNDGETTENVGVKSNSQLFFGKYNIFQVAQNGLAEVFFGSKLKDLKSEFLSHKMRGNRVFDPAGAAESDVELAEADVSTFLKMRSLKETSQAGSSDLKSVVPMGVWLNAEPVSLR